MGDSSEFKVGQRVRIYPDTDKQSTGVVAEDFGDSAGFGVCVASLQIAAPARRWAVSLDDGGLVFVDSADLAESDVDEGTHSPAV
jgi:hypothetical protein